VSDIKLGSFPSPSVAGAATPPLAQMRTPEEALRIILPKVTEVPAAIKNPRLSPASLRQQLDQAVEELNIQMAKTGRALGFSYDKAAAQSVITVTNKDTGEVLRQIPGDAVLNVAHSIESLKGILYSNVM
jgi:flagellar protein FlaG